MSQPIAKPGRARPDVQKAAGVQLISELAKLDPSTPASIEDGPSKRVRKPFGSHVQKLAYPVRPGYHRHTFNDSPGRIALALEAGYEHVNDESGKKICRPVDSSGMLGYLMEIPQEWYDEDMAAQQAKNDEIDSAIRGGAVAGAPGEDGRYIPTQGIKISGQKSAP